MVTNTTTLLAKHTQTMSLVDHDGCVVFLLQLYNLRKGSQVAFHREHAVNDDELNLVGIATLQYALQVGHVVMLIMQLGCECQTTTVDDTCMVAVITDDIVVLANKLRNNAAVYGKTGRDAQGVVLAYVLCQLLLKLNMDVECTIQETATSATTTILLHGLATSLDDAIVARKTRVSV